MAGKGKDSRDSRVVKLALVGGESKPTGSNWDWRAYPTASERRYRVHRERCLRAGLTVLRTVACPVADREPFRTRDCARLQVEKYFRLVASGRSGRQAAIRAPGQGLGMEWRHHIADFQL